MNVRNATSDWCGIACAVDAGSLAIPDAEHAVDGLVRIGFDLLRAEEGGRGEVFVDGRQEFDRIRVEKRFCAPQFLVDGAERRAAIAADEAGRVQSRSAIDRALHQRYPHEGLGTGQEYAPRLAPVTIEEFVIVERVRSGSEGLCGGGHGFSCNG